MRYALTALIVSVAAFTPPRAYAQSADPYAADVARVARGRLERSYQNYLDNIAFLYFALGCKVLQDDGQFAYALRARQVQYLINRAASSEEMKEGIRKATEDGRIRASDSCNYWREDPRRVLDVRQAVQLQIMP